MVSATDCFNRLWNNNHTRTGRLVCSVNSVNSVNRTTPVWQQRLHTKKTHLETMSSLSSGLPVGNEPILCCPCVNIYSKYLYKYEENLLKETGMNWIVFLHELRTNVSRREEKQQLRSWLQDGGPAVQSWTRFSVGHRADTMSTGLKIWPGGHFQPTKPQHAAHTP